MSELMEEALQKAFNFHWHIESDEALQDRLSDREEWHQFREVMIRLSLS